LRSASDPQSRHPKLLVNALIMSASRGLTMEETRPAGFTGYTDDDILTPAEAAYYLNKSTFTLKRWRTERIGPPYIKNGGAIEYRLGDLRAYRIRCLRLLPKDALGLAGR
jgi:hypothetical protein